METAARLLGSLPPKGVLLLTSQPVEDVEPEVQPQRIIHAGLDG